MFFNQVKEGILNYVQTEIVNKADMAKKIRGKRCLNNINIIQ